MESLNRTPWTVAASFTTDVEAHIAMGMLEAEGIPCRLNAPIMSTLYGAGSTWAPIQILVPDQYLTRAIELLQSHQDA